MLIDVVYLLLRAYSYAYKCMAMLVFEMKTLLPWSEDIRFSS